MSEEKKREWTQEEAREFIILLSHLPRNASEDFQDGYLLGIETARHLVEKQFIERGYMPEDGRLLLV